MSKNYRLIRSLAICAALSAGLAACGGGGDDGGDDDLDTPIQAPPPAGSVGGGAGGGTGGGGVGSSTESTEVVVQLKRGINVITFASFHQLTLKDQFGKRPIYRFSIPAGANVNTVVQSLINDSSRVRYAEPNLVSETPEGRNFSVWALGGDANTFAKQWAPSSIRLAGAHSTTTGAGIRVAILDTGVDATHPALAMKMARNGAGTVLGRDLVDDDNDASEVGSTSNPGYGHGTHAAGLVALVAPSAKIMPVRVLDSAGKGNIWVLSEGLGWAVDPDGNPNTDDGAHVVNISIGTLRQTELLKTVVGLANCEFNDDDDDFQDTGFDDDRTRCANKFGAVAVAAAGNSGSETEMQYPAAEAGNLKGAIAITASAQNRRLPTFANRGSWIKTAAPGDQIISTVPGGGYGVWSGTSMAAPIAAGTAALVLSTLPPSGNAAQAPARQWLFEDVIKRLQDRGSKLCGTGIMQIDATSAVTDAQAPDPVCS
jgi:subtilisin family serine protease